MATEEDQIITMLKRCEIEYTLAAGDEPFHSTVEVIGQKDNPHVLSFSHCYVKWTFDKEGKLVYLEFGY